MGPSHLSRNYTQPPVITLVSRAAVKIDLCSVNLQPREHTTLLSRTAQLTSYSVVKVLPVTLFSYL